MEIVATLSERETPAAKEPPENRILFPEYETLRDPYSDLAKNLIDDFKIKHAYLDLLKRYADDESQYDMFRLNLFRYIHRDPLRFPRVAEDICRRAEFLGKKNDIPGMIRFGASLLDESFDDTADAIVPPKSSNPEAHLAYIRSVLDSALFFRNLAFEKLEKDDETFLNDNLPLLIENGFESYSSEIENNDEEVKKGQKVLHLLQKVDYGLLFKSAETLSRLSNPEWLSDFKKALTGYNSSGPITVRGITGSIIYAEEWEAGLIVIGGTGANRYDRNTALLVDLGGNDFYTAGAASSDAENPLSILIDLEGNDEYSATRNFAEGAGIMGVGILIDLAGDDTYHGVKFSQGTGIIGTGILADFKGNDGYFGQEYNQGFGFCGMGLVLDSAGNDYYQSHISAQAVGGPKGAGILFDASGDDSYYATGKEPGTYGTPGIFSGYSQGFGIGVRHHASGGIGMLIDSAGRDRFRAGNFSQGGGYYFGLGILKNSGDEDDEYIGSHYGQGFSAHSAAGILIDDGGNDLYRGHVGALQSAAWDMGLAALIDKSGNDTYESAGLFFSQGAAANNGFSIFIDMTGKDEYSYTEEKKVPGNTYHGGYSISFFIDSGGDIDHYNGSSRGNNGIFIEGEYGIRADLDRDIEEVLENEQFRQVEMR
jgi:hypothetical protein